MAGQFLDPLDAVAVTPELPSIFIDPLDAVPTATLAKNKPRQNTSRTSGTRKRKPEDTSPQQRALPATVSH
jgi:hypothetical protein